MTTTIIKNTNLKNKNKNDSVIGIDVEITNTLVIKENQDSSKKAIIKEKEGFS